MGHQRCTSGMAARQESEMEESEFRTGLGSYMDEAAMVETAQLCKRAFRSHFQMTHDPGHCHHV